MAWTESCKIDANKQVEHLKERGMSVRQAIKKLSEESGIPANTINNWIYERTPTRKRIDAFSHFFDTIHDEFIEDGTFTKEQVKEIGNNAKLVGLWGIMWLYLEEKYVFNWYLDAFGEYGQFTQLTDMFRTGHIWCTCPKCDGKVRKREPLLESALTDKIQQAISPKPKGYVNFNAIPK